SQAGISAAFINSSLAAGEYAQVLRNAALGAYKIIYVAPERLHVDSFLQFAMQADISLVTVDEAHCVSQWGQDFRPSYTDIYPFIKKLSKRPVVSAFTATATPEVRSDIIRLLGLANPYVVTTGFDRPNLHFEVQEPSNKFKALQSIVKRNSSKSGIVYCATRKAVEEVCEKLQDEGYSATRYHAGLEDVERQRNQNDFIFDRRQIMVATNAFGMGIDKSNVSFVVHYNMPKSLEAYYQEAGRAGRDGERAECVLLYAKGDVRLNQYLIEMGNSENINKDNDLLKVMTFYATTTDCLRCFILKYFGEHPQFESGFAHCGNCGNCSTQFEELDITIDAQKIVSCVYRLTQRKQQYGKGMIAEILRGGTGEKLTKAGLESLSTYGIMADTSARRLYNMMDFLVDKGLLDSKAGDYPVIVLSEQSNKVLKERIPLTMKIAKDRVTRKERKKGSEESGLFKSLKLLRSALAKDAGVPAYIIFADSSLRDMCEKKPKTYSEFLGISGVGKSKADKYAKVFTSLIASYVEEEATTPSPELTNKGKPWDLYEDKRLQQGYEEGKSIKQLASSHGRTDGSIRSRLRKLGLIE
ncbi:MAG: RecQ family ATP-dependent DNA helicase, partial [Deferribacteraceae bacterium]|nr:RecQ family ATP-dependent DNA helicase [Deferribacteraceae bacterium]